MGLGSGSGMLSVLATSVGNFSVAYNFSSIALALIIMSSSVCTSTDDNCKEGEQADWVDSTESAVVFAGAICGQLSMGYVGDLIGRGPALGITLAIAALSALFSAVLSLGDATSIYACIIVFRFFLGLGLGGVYPLSAAKAAEDGGGGGHNSVNVTAAAWAFFWQIPGIVCPWFLGFIFSYTTLKVSEQWRLILGVGAIPASLVVLFTMIEHYQATNQPYQKSSALERLTPRYDLSPLDAHRSSSLTIEAQAFKAEQQATSEAVKVAFKDPKTWRKLLVSGGCWFVYDVCTYGIVLFSGEIIGDMLPHTDDVSSQMHIRKVCTFQLYAAIFGFPAAFITLYYLRFVSVRWVQIVGFSFIALGFLIMAVVFKTLKTGSIGLFICYIFLTMTLQGGASMTTYVISTKLYPKNIRSTLNGISAACGKSGAVVGAYLFGTVAEDTSFSAVMVICLVLAIIAVAITYFFLDPMDNNSNDDDSATTANSPSPPPSHTHSMDSL